MTVVSVVATIVYIALLIFWLFMLARLVLDLIRLFARRWRLRGQGSWSPRRCSRSRIRRSSSCGASSRRFGSATSRWISRWTIVAFAVLILMWIVGGFR